MARALASPVLLALGLGACVAAGPVVRADWLSDLSLCGMPSEVQALGNPLRLSPSGVTGAGLSCRWAPQVDPERLGVVQRRGSCTAAGQSAPAQFLIGVGAGAVQVESDHPQLRRTDFGRCALPEPAAPGAPAAAPEPAAGDKAAEAGKPGDGA